VRALDDRFHGSRHKEGLKWTPILGPEAKLGQDCSVMVDGANDEEDETEDQRCTEGKDRPGGGAGTIDDCGFGTTVSPAPHFRRNPEAQAMRTLFAAASINAWEATTAPFAHAVLDRGGWQLGHIGPRRFSL
jgi:hypothetical protein